MNECDKNRFCIPIELHDADGEKVRARDVEGLTVRIWTQNPRETLTFRGADILALADSDNLCVDLREMGALESGVMEYRYSYFDPEGDCPVRGIGATDLYWRNLGNKGANIYGLIDVMKEAIAGKEDSFTPGNHLEMDEGRVLNVVDIDIPDLSIYATTTQVEELKTNGVNKLSRPVNLWGNEFDGSKDISGPMRLKDDIGLIDIKDFTFRAANGRWIYRWKDAQGGEPETVISEIPWTFQKDITSPNIQTLEEKLEGVNKAIDITASVKDITPGSTTGLYINSEDGEDGKTYTISIDEFYFATVDYVDRVKRAILGSETLNESYDTLQEVAEWIETHSGDASQIISRQNAIEAKLQGVTKAADVTQVAKLSNTINGLLARVAQLEKDLANTKIETSNE